MEWASFKDNITTPIQEPEITSTFIQTESLTSYKYIINELLPRKVNVIVSGETGAGKTLMIKHHLLGIDKVFQVASTMFCVRTTSGDAQNCIEGNLNKMRKGCIGPEINKFRVFMIDDANMWSTATNRVTSINC